MNWHQPRYFKAVGEYHKMRAIDTYSLLAEEVFASIKLHNSPDELRGRLIEMPYIDHIDIFKGTFYNYVRSIHRIDTTPPPPPPPPQTVFYLTPEVLYCYVQFKKW